ncbi:hypothetical protein H2202_001689 [Exophiala xenobiotica]|nr:hypothetical protein H2202_001689 [Exophiala xenobiotica]
MPAAVWTPSQPADQIPINIYRKHINNKFKLRLRDSHELQRWSVSDPQAFWVDLWDYVGLIPKLPPGVARAYDSGMPISEVPPFFEGATVNYAENVLTQPDVNNQTTALIGLREGKSLDGERWTWSVLRENVRRVRSALLRSGIKQGDRVAALVSTSVWSVALFLGSASIGAIFTSIAPDLGLEPVILFADSHCTYKGRQQSNATKISQTVGALKSRPEAFVIETAPTQEFPTLSTFLERSRASDTLEFERLPFTTPLYILYSSGTSGPPKALVHSHAAILQHKKIGMLHNSLKPGDVVFQYSSTSWVLWNIMIGHLSMGTTLIMYDGSPTWPQPQSMLRIVEKFKVNYWGASPKYLKELESTRCTPKKDYDLSSLKMVQTGGSHLAADQYHWFYKVFPPTVHLTSVTGGTDLVTSWCGTDPAGPVYPGEIQMAILGHDVDIADLLDGHSIKETGEAGVELSPRDIDTDRDSDGVLNPQGIRFGSAEIYSITEAAPFPSQINMTLCASRRRPGLDTDESVFLFVVMRPGHVFSLALRKELKESIRQGLSSRHVPRFVVEVREIPMTVNGKKVETLVKQVISTGALPKTISSTVANPGCLEEFRRFYSLEIEARAKL